MIALALYLVAVVFIAAFFALALRNDRRNQAREYGELFGPTENTRERLLADKTYGEWF